MLEKDYMDKVWHLKAMYPARRRKIRVKDDWEDNYIDKSTGKEYAEAALFISYCNYPDNDKVWVCLQVTGKYDNRVMFSAVATPFAEVGKVYKHMRTIYKKLPHDKDLQKYLLEKHFSYDESD